MKKKVLFVFLAFLCSFVFLSDKAHAFLIGDTITLEHDWPTLADVNLSATRIVVAGTGDLWTFVEEGDIYSVNPEDNAILVNFLLDGGWTASVFNGLVVSGIDTPINSISIDTNMQGWDISRLAFGSSYFQCNWQDLLVTPQTYFNVNLNIASVPEPATLSLLGLGLLGLVFKKNKLA